MRFDTVFFDIGNTLFFYNYEFLGGFLAERFDMDIHPMQLEEMHKRAQRELVSEGILQSGHSAVWDWTYRRWFKHAGIDESTTDSVLEAIKAHPFNHLFWTRMEEGVPGMLDWFRERGFKLGIISNAEGQIVRLLKHVNIHSKFDVVADSCDVGFDKPHEGIFRYALDAVGSDPERTVYVGDLYDTDIVGARNVGMTPVLVERIYNSNHRDCITVARATDLPGLELFKGI
jgi:HAD superfamily hydrolase (TIGR01662 family)